MNLGDNSSEVHDLTILVEREAPEQVLEDVIALREPYQTVYYCSAHGLPGG